MGRWQYRATKRWTVIPGIARANVNLRKLAAALADGPGGQRVRDAVSWTVGWLGHVTVNTRTGRGSVNTPGPGGFQGPVLPSQAERRRRRRRR